MQIRYISFLGYILLSLPFLLGACDILSPPPQEQLTPIIANATVPLAQEASLPDTPVSIPTTVLILPAPKTAIPIASPTSSTDAMTTNCGQAEFIRDVNVPLGTVFNPGEQFFKTWRVKNTSSCYWTIEYAVILEGGTQMGNTISTFLPAPVPPGSETEISVNLTAPLERGYYQSYWKLRDPQGSVFGCGLQASDPLLVQIEVAGIAPVWTSYKDYGFDFTYPASWSLRQEKNFIYISEGGRTFIIAYKLASESTSLYSGISRGEEETLLTRAYVPFLGKTISRQVFLNEKMKVKAVFYSDRGDVKIAVGGIDPISGITHPKLVFSIWVQDSIEYAAINIPEVYQSALDTILTSFRWIEK